MAWYRTGTVAVTNGSPVVTGTGTNFVSNTQAGEAFLGPDGLPYEIAQVVSATQLTLAQGYRGGSAGGQGYAVLPTQSFVRDLALGAAELLGSFAEVRDGIGQGLIGDGTAATPGIRFGADQDTGIRRAGANALSLVAGGKDALVINSDGAQMSRLVVDNLLLAGVPDGSSHTVYKAAAVGAPILSIEQAGRLPIAVAYGVDFNGVESANAALAAFKLGRSTTGRSLSTSGTLNANGADYAEYMTKSDSCGMIAPGDVCGVDAGGKLTRTWAEAISYVVKSTDPAYVGGDSWAAHLPPRPAQEAGEDDATFAARLAPWEAQLEAARFKVDRIAFAGQVPVNVSGDFAPGDYLIAAAAGAGIKAVAVSEADITFDQYRRRLGKVWGVRDGRAWLDVQHG
ncbi:hypothetical protein [Sphingomonas aracearum]|uniref:Peptidase S74 domain-containing protein n=1 Tax=Sphingomonas aracearum TaxID=2283317 RepID=A0A369VUA2_9SPHN|nr:hypothetical protein [Sphingomonas aracearum]RDE05439.1 hypothetical protein DVW87_09315 [Sphingomonas aracearum]